MTGLVHHTKKAPASLCMSGGGFWFGAGYLSRHEQHDDAEEAGCGEYLHIERF